MKASGNLTDCVVTHCHMLRAARGRRASSEIRAASLTNRRRRHRWRGQPHVDVPMLCARSAAPGDDFLVQLEHPGHQVLHRPGWRAELEKLPVVPIGTPCGRPGARWLTGAGKTREVAHHRVAERMFLHVVGRTRPVLRPAVARTDPAELVWQLAGMESLDMQRLLRQVVMCEEIQIRGQPEPRLISGEAFGAPAVERITCCRERALLDVRRWVEREICRARSA